MYFSPAVYATYIVVREFPKKSFEVKVAVWAWPTTASDATVAANFI
jgi:hypothetical protein